MWPDDIEPAQRLDELEAMLALLKREGVRSYLEIGLKNGATLRRVAQTLPRYSLLVGIDMPGASAWGVRPEKAELARDRLLALQAEQQLEGQRLLIIFGNSRDAGIVDAAAKFGPYDAVFVDADHTIEGVRADWMNYGPMGRMVLFHDIDAKTSKVRTGRIYECGVHKLWAQLKGRYRHEEIIGAERGMGIGVLWVN